MGYHTTKVYRFKGGITMQIESTDTHRPTPWGKADYQYKIQRGVALVNTPGHGGFLIGQGIAQTYLSPEAIKAGEPFGSYLAYEEDVDAAIVLFEHPELIERLGFVNTTNQDLLQTLVTYRKDYLVARGLAIGGNNLDHKQ
jgi:hypothetical protein